MKKLATLFISVLLVPLAMGAARAMANETVYVLKNTNRQYITDPTEFVTACGFALQLGAISAVRSDLYSIQTQSAQGRVVNDHVKKVGELIACVLEPTVNSDPAEFFPLYPGLAENIVDPTPSQNLNVIYTISLNGEEYISFGSGRARTEGGWGIPYPGLFLVGGSGTLSKISSAGPAFVGSLTNNVAIEVVPGNVDPEKTGGIIVLRISQPGVPWASN